MSAAEARPECCEPQAGTPAPAHSRAGDFGSMVADTVHSTCAKEHAGTEASAGEFVAPVSPDQPSQTGNLIASVAGQAMGGEAYQLQEEGHILDGTSNRTQNPHQS
jgi:hypothetical protein